MTTIALYHPDKNYANSLKLQFEVALKTQTISFWQPNTSASYVVAWKPFPALVKTPNLQVIFALGAGVDAFLEHQIPRNIQLVRLLEAGMGKQMLEIVLYGILHFSRDMIALSAAQSQNLWMPSSTPKKLPFSTKIGVMGLGKLGTVVATFLAKLGYPVSGYSKSLKNIPSIHCYDKNTLDDFLSDSEVLINLLPLTPATKNILNTSIFNKLPKGSYLINIARGKHLVEEDLLLALRQQQLSGALLDVFQTEPLPVEHPFWQHPNIIVLPHLAAITLQHDAVSQISANIVAHQANKTMSGIVDTQNGY